MNAKKKLLFVAVALGLLAGQAEAALPTAAVDAFTNLNSSITEVLGYVWGAVTLWVGGSILVKLFKKGANKAT